MTTFRRTLIIALAVTSQLQSFTRIPEEILALPRGIRQLFCNTLLAQLDELETMSSPTTHRGSVTNLDKDFINACIIAPLSATDYRENNQATHGTGELTEEALDAQIKSCTEAPTAAMLFLPSKLPAIIKILELNLKNPLESKIEIECCKDNEAMTPLSPRERYSCTLIQHVITPMFVLSGEQYLSYLRGYRTILLPREQEIRNKAVARCYKSAPAVHHHRRKSSTTTTIHVYPRTPVPAKQSKQPACCIL